MNYIITVDVETGDRSSPTLKNFETHVEKGMKRLLKKLSVHGLKADFFMNVYESAIYGETEWGNLCREIFEAGSGVNLHTHPHYLTDDDRKNMHEYTLSEQIEIVRYGRDFIEKWTKRFPLVHKAGYYGASLNTIKALKTNGIFIDGSYFYRHPNCKLKHSNINQPFDVFGVKELPVSVVCIRRDFPYIPLLRKVWYQRIDINEDLNLNQNSIFNVGQLNFSPIILTGHSFDIPSAENLDKVFNYLKKNGSVVRCGEVLNAFPENYSRQLP